MGGRGRRSRLTRYTRRIPVHAMLVKVFSTAERASIRNIPCRTCHPCWRQSGFIDLTQPLTTSSKAERAACAYKTSLFLPVMALLIRRLISRLISPPNRNAPLSSSCRLSIFTFRIVFLQGFSRKRMEYIYVYRINLCESRC